MQRRDFIKVIGSTTAWPLAARAQQADRIRRVGVLMTNPETDASSLGQVAAFKRRLQELGWIEGRNVRFDFFWEPDVDRARAAAKKLVESQPDVIVAHTVLAAKALQQETRAIPIVFTIVSDPHGAGLIESVTHPGGNITGFTNMEPNMGRKWLELLKEMAPQVKRVAVILDPQRTPTAVAFAQLIEAAGPQFGVEVSVAPVHDPAEFESVIAKIGREPGGGLITPPDLITYNYRKLLAEAAARYQVPSVHPYRVFAVDGALASYGTDSADMFRQVATYVDRILRGESPANLPVQAPTKFQLVINLKTAQTLGLTVPLTLLATADEIIE
jgi:putative tryptophan/tyrosine transport system substrate-binding protein